MDKKLGTATKYISQVWIPIFGSWCFTKILLRLYLSACRSSTEDLGSVFLNRSCGFPSCHHHAERLRQQRSHVSASETKAKPLPSRCCCWQHPLFAASPWTKTACDAMRSAQALSEKSSRQIYLLHREHLERNQCSLRFSLPDQRTAAYRRSNQMVTWGFSSVLLLLLSTYCYMRCRSSSIQPMPMVGPRTHFWHALIVHDWGFNGNLRRFFMLKKSTLLDRFEQTFYKTVCIYFRAPCTMKGHRWKTTSDL